MRNLVGSQSSNRTREQSSNNPMETSVKTLHEYHFNRLQKIPLCTGCGVWGVGHVHTRRAQTQLKIYNFNLHLHTHTYIDLDMWTDFYCNVHFVVCFYYCFGSNSFVPWPIPISPFSFHSQFPFDYAQISFIRLRIRHLIASKYYVTKHSIRFRFPNSRL